VQTKSQEDLTLAKKPSTWIKERVSKAESQFSKSEGGKLIWASIESHGGLETWFKNGPLSFRFDYIPLNGKTPRKTIQQIDTWSNKAVHQLVDDPNNTFGWDGTDAWVMLNDSFKIPFDVRFWALTPYYFLGQPFIFDGEGVEIEKIEDQTLLDTIYDAVKISFKPGTGDAPDDYYINYLDKSTHLLKAIKYIVSYPEYFEKGKHSPEKIMIIKSYDEYEGIVLATAYETFSTDENGNQEEKVTAVKVSNIEFKPNLKNTYFDKPEGSKTVE
jgi:hypothetical protein